MYGSFVKASPVCILLLLLLLFALLYSILSRRKALARRLLLESMASAMFTMVC